MDNKLSVIKQAFKSLATVVAVGILNSGCASQGGVNQASEWPYKGEPGAVCVPDSGNFSVDKKDALSQAQVDLANGQGATVTGTQVLNQGYYNDDAGRPVFCVRVKGDVRLEK